VSGGRVVSNIGASSTVSVPASRANFGDSRADPLTTHH
jgi:hypothetical protein